SAVGGVPVLIDQLTQYFHGFFRCGRTFHGNARKIRVLRSGLSIRGHLDELFTRVGPYVACSNVLLVETTVGSRCWEPCKLGIIRGDVPVGFFYLWDLGELSGQISFFGR